MSTSMTEKPPKRRGFMPGDPKPPNSGARKGMKFAKTRRKMESEKAIWNEVKHLSPTFKGMSAQQILDELEINPVVYSALMLRQLASEPDHALVCYKYVELLTRITNPTMRAVETTTTTRSQVQVVIRNAGPSIFEGTAEPAPEALTHDKDFLNDVVMDFIEDHDQKTASLKDKT